MTTQQSTPNLDGYHWTPNGWFQIVHYNDNQPVPVTSVSRWVEGSNGWKYTHHHIEENTCTCNRGLNCLHKKAVEVLGDRVVQHYEEVEEPVRVKEPEPTKVKPTPVKRVVTPSTSSGSFKLSLYQEAILEAVKARIISKGSKPGLLIEALAGCGKSATLALIAGTLNELGVKPEECRLVVFGKKNQLDLSDKLSRVGYGWKDSVKTLHSLSLSVLNASGIKTKVNAYKYHNIGRDLGYLGTWRDNQYTVGSLVDGGLVGSDNDFIDLLDKLRLYCYEPVEDKVLELVELHNLDIHPANASNVAAIAKELLVEGLNQARLGVIDFTDMSWVLVQLQDQCKGAIQTLRSKLRFVALDECQDTDQLQIEVLKLLIDPQRSFLCAVGDRYQAVYNFRGCLSNGLETIAQVFNCESLPLPVNYRCGIKHLAFVRELFPAIGILPHDGASEGSIRFIRSSELEFLFADKNGDYLGLCRKNAPLVQTALKLLSKGLPVKIKDKALGDRLVALVKKVAPKYSHHNFVQDLTTYSSKELERTKTFANHEKYMADLYDKLDALMALFEAFEPMTLKAWKDTVDRIFDQSGYEKAINLYSIHSGKGGEAKDAFIINPQSLPLVFKDASEEQIQQEWNLLYVALTRAKETLTIAIEEKDGEYLWPSWAPERMRVFS
jgi:DNA helicase II / ATP-dependent DNA helicase PcrA